jgi:predicted dehydrogenase
VHQSEIIIAGLGSIGRRHLANLRTLGWERVRLYRTGRATLPDADLQGWPVDHDLDEALGREPVAVIISNPTALHVPVAIAAARAGAHLLIEKPLSHSLDGVAELAAAVEARGLQAMVGFQFRFDPGLQQIARWITGGSIGRVTSVLVHWGESLPDMHPWEDYRTGYAARDTLGGGVLNTLCHPFDYLRWLLGDDCRVLTAQAQKADLGLAVETCADVTLGFAGGATATVHLDFLQRPRAHRLVVAGTEGTAGWNDGEHVAWLSMGRRRPREIVLPPPGFDRNTMFIEEMAHFLACVRGEQRPRCTLNDGLAALQIVLSAKRATADLRAETPLQTT